VPSEPPISLIIPEPVIPQPGPPTEEPTPVELPTAPRVETYERPGPKLLPIPDVISKEPPPPTPEEQKLRQFLSDPKNWRQLINYARMFPERYERLMQFIERFYPRALPEGEVAFLQRWYADQARQIRERLQAYQLQWEREMEEYQREMEALREATETFLQMIDKAATPEDVIRVLRQAAGSGLTPERYQLLSTAAKTKILAILSQLPTQDAERALDILHRRGFFTDRELDEFKGYMRGESWARGAIGSLLGVTIERLRAAIERARRLGWDVGNIERQLNAIAQYVEQMRDMPPNPELANFISSQLTKLPQDFERLVSNTLNPLATSIQRLVGRLYDALTRPDQVLQWFRENMRVIQNTLGKFSPELTSTLMRTIGTTAQATHVAMVDGLRILADALDDTLNKLKSEFGDFPEVIAPLTLLEGAINALRERSEALSRIANVLRSIYDKVGQAIKEDPLKGISPAQMQRFRLQEWGLRLRDLARQLNEARLRLAEEMFDWRKQNANISNALRFLGILVSMKARLGKYEDALVAATTLADILNDLAKLEDTDKELSPEIVGAVKVIKDVVLGKANELVNALQGKKKPEPDQVDTMIRDLLRQLGILLSSFEPEPQPTRQPSPRPTTGGGGTTRPQAGGTRPTTQPQTRPTYRGAIGGFLTD
jgi:DNA repair exonuclease SbcCD ATPase subunit